MMPRAWSPAAPEAKPKLADTLRELSALLGSAYTSSDLAEDMGALGYLVQASTVRGWLAAGAGAGALRHVERVQLYIRATGFRPSDCLQDPSSELETHSGRAISLRLRSDSGPLDD